MFIEQEKIDSWRNEIAEYDHKRKNVAWDHFEPNHIITWKEIKTKEVEYHPILHKFASPKNEQFVSEKDKAKIEINLKKKKEREGKYEKDYDIVNLETNPNNTANKIPEKPIKPKYIPSAQVDYNLITNEKLNDIYWKNTIRYVEKKTRTEKQDSKDNRRDYNIITGYFTKDHEKKLEEEKMKNQQNIQESFKKTHDYNILLCNAYDPKDEEAYKMKQEEKIKQRAKAKEMHLPPTVLKREPVIFDFTKEKPEAVKIIDQRTLDSKKRYELRYKVENEISVQNNEHHANTLDLIKKRYQSIKNTETAESTLAKIDSIKYVNTSKNANQPTGLILNAGLSSWDKLALLSNTSKPHNSASAQGLRQTVQRKHLTLNDENIKEKPVERTSTAESKRTNSVYYLADKYNNYTTISPGVLLRASDQNSLPHPQTLNKTSSDTTILPKFRMIQTGGFNLK